MKAKIAIPLITLCLGFFPLLVMSILSNGFWINSPYDFPLVLIPAVLIGDSILLPLLNYRIYIALKKVQPLLKSKTINMTVFSGVLFAIPINAYTHYVWSHGSSTGFMEPQYGVLSPAGWWHIVISVIQMTVIYTFAVLWALTVKGQNQNTFEAFKKSTYILMAFNVVNASGIFINKDLVIHMRFAMDISFTSVFNSLFPLICALLLLYFMRKLHRSTNNSRPI